MYKILKAIYIPITIKYNYEESDSKNIYIIKYTIHTITHQDSAMVIRNQ